MIEKTGENTFEFNNNLKEIRRKLNFTQQELAETIGVSRNTISSIERRVFIPTAKLALIICIALEVNFEELFYFKEISSSLDKD